MGFFKTQKEKEERRKERKKLKLEIRKRNEIRRITFQEQNKKNKEMRNFYRERLIEERRLREKKTFQD
jgi:hypothetical protein